MMEILILGSGTGVPTRKRSSPGIVVSQKNLKILIDPSAGTQKRLIEEGIDSRDIDAILISHFHPDHCGDLIPLLFCWKSEIQFRTKPLTIIGPVGLKKFYTSLSKTYELDFTSHAYRMRFKEMSHGDKTKFKSLNISTYAIPHTEKSIGFRIEDAHGKVLAYTGDTDYSSEIIPFCRDADLLITECAFPEKYKVNGHLIPSLAGEIARKSKSKKLLLTHFYPIVDEDEIVTIVTNLYNGTLYLAQDGLRVFV